MDRGQAFTSKARGRSVPALAAILAAFVLLAGAVAATPVAAAPALPSSVTDTDQVVIHWSGLDAEPASADGAVAASRTAALSNALGQQVRFVRATPSGADVFRLPQTLGQGAQRKLDALRHVAGVATVEPDLWMTADALPNDTYASLLWGLKGTADGSTYGIDALGAWATTRGSGVVVAVIDTGIVTHPDLAGQTVTGYDMITDPTISNDGDGRDADASDPGDWCTKRSENSSWHGTHVAGTIAAIANNAMGVFGGAPDARIEPVRVLGQCGGYSTDIADGIRWASGASVSGVPANANPAKVLNLSLGGSYPTCPTEYTSAIATARANGAVVVVAAGNSNVDASGSTPANCPDAITVAATDQNGKKASFSNYGSAVDIAGPGVSIASTIDSGTTVPLGPTYAYYSGTSMAAPHVAVAAALLMAARPSLTPDQVGAVLADTVTPFAADASGTGCPTLGCGKGIANAGRAVAGLAVGPAISPNPASVSGYWSPSATFHFGLGTASAGVGLAGAEVSVAGGPWTALEAVDGAFDETAEDIMGFITSPADEGTFQVCFRATDVIGRTSDGTACVPLKVDAGPPNLTAPAFNPASPHPGDTILVTATATDAFTVTGGEFNIDGAGWVAAAAADGAYDSSSEVLSTTTSLAVGSHSVCARATDIASYRSDGTACSIVNVAVPPVPVASFSVTSTTAWPAGSAQSVTVTARDSGGAVVTGYTGTVHFTSSDPAAVLPADYTFTTGDAGVHTFTVELRTAGTRSISVADATATGIAGSQAGIAVTPVGAASLAVSVSTSWVAGTPRNVTVTAKDPYGNTATGYAGTIHWTATDPSAVLPADYTFTPGDAGRHVFSITLRTAGTRTISAADTGPASISGTSASLTVRPAALANFLVTTTTTWVAGVSHTVYVTARDAYGNKVTTYTGTVHFSSSDPAAVLPGDHAFSATDRGVHSFVVTLKTAGMRTITATDTVATSITGSQTGIAVRAGAVKRLSVTTTTSWIAGGSHSVYVIAKDAYGNTVTTYAGTVHFSSTDGAATLPADYTFSGTDRGVHTFVVALRTPGTQSITVTDVANATITGSQAGIVVSPKTAVVGPR